MSDPRNPKRPEGESGENWAKCRQCNRAAVKIVLIRHTKKCLAKPELAELSLMEFVLILTKNWSSDCRTSPKRTILPRGAACAMPQVSTTVLDALSAQVKVLLQIMGK